MHSTKEHTILPKEVLFTVFKQMAEVSFTGVFNYHIYNEPMIDPRLFYFTMKAKDFCPKSTNLIYTNGYYLDQNLLNEMYDYGIDKMIISLYTQQEYNRIKSLNFGKISVHLYDAQGHILDNRLAAYDKPLKPIAKPCTRNAPFEDISINCRGDVVLCCIDYKGFYNFGNILNEDLQTIINKPRFIKIYETLKNGERICELCQACTWQ